VIAEKERLVGAWLDRFRPATVWDLGANTGRFSRLASARGIDTVAFDADPAAYLPPSFPRPAPPFELRDLGGKPLSTKSLEGQVVLLDFWATWCAGCKVEIPWFIEFDKMYRSKGLAAIGVSMDEEGWKTIEAEWRRSTWAS
jgi:thiol-disulfide isomerase/thioredoxin